MCAVEVRFNHHGSAATEVRGGACIDLRLTRPATEGFKRAGLGATAMADADSLAAGRTDACHVRRPARLFPRDGVIELGLGHRDLRNEDYFELRHEASLARFTKAAPA